MLERKNNTKWLWHETYMNLPWIWHNELWHFHAGFYTLIFGYFSFKKIQSNNVNQLKKLHPKIQTNK